MTTQTRVIKQAKTVTEHFQFVRYGIPKKNEYYRSIYDKQIYKAESGKDCIVNTAIFRKVKRAK